MANDGAVAGAAAPLLGSCTSEYGKPRCNLYPFTCAMLASMSTVLMGYSESSAVLPRVERMCVVCS